jgi:hypothetical protein
MTNEFDEVMAQRSDADLVTILNSAPGDYQPAAMKAAKRVFNSRKLSQEQIAIAEQKIEQDQLREEAKANEPLTIGYKIWALVFPGLFLIIFSGTFESYGYTRKAKELRMWTLYGFCFYVGLLLLSIIL